MKDINGLFVDEVQLPEVAEPPTVPVIFTELLLQIIWSGPALTVAFGLMITIIVSLTELHGPTGSLDVKINLTNPAALSIADNV